MKQLDPKAVWLFFLQSLIFWIIIYTFISSNIALTVIGIFQLNLQAAIAMYIISLATTGLLSFFFAKLSYKYYKYELTPEGFKKESGIIWKKYVTIPYERIQNVDIYRGIFARMLGLSDLHIQTAGYSGPRSSIEGRLPGLSRVIAEQLRDELIRRSKSQIPQQPIPQTQAQNVPAASPPPQNTTPNQGV